MILRGFGGLIACRKLAGETEVLVEFNYDGTVTSQGLTLLSDVPVHRFFVEAVDTDGNSSVHMPFSLTENSPHRIAILEGHTSWLRSVSFSHDGSILASGGEDETVKLWDVATQQDFGTLPHGATVTSVSFSTDGRLLASGTVDGAVRIWDVATQQDFGTFLHGTEVTSVSFSRDGTPLASGSRNGTVKLWNVTTGQEIGTLPHGAGITSVAFSRDGMLLASGGQDKTVKLWDMTTRQEIGTLEGHRLWVYSMSFSPDERTLASTGGTTVKLWDVTTQQNVGILQHGSDIGSVAFSRDGWTLASGAVDGTVKLWDVASGANFAVVGSTSGVNSVSISSDGVTLAAGTHEGTIELWDISAWMRERLEAVAEVDIPDPNLRAAITTALGKLPSAPIVQGNMPTLTRLEAREANISNLTGLSGSTNLTILDLGGNNISDISSVAGLTKLTSLKLFSNNISDISSVVGLTKLRFLDLANNNISNIGAVAELTNLTSLSLWGNNISDISSVAGLTKLTSLELGDNNISNIGAVAELTNLTFLSLFGNNISDISVVVGLTKLNRLYLERNNISNISPLVDNTGLGRGDEVYILGNPLSYPSIYTHIPALRERGVEVLFDNRTPQRIRIVSGIDQVGLTGEALEKPFVVQVQDERGVAFEGVPVTFTVTASDGALSTTNTATDANGRAESTLTLGLNPGTNTVTVSVAGIQAQQTFTAVGIRIPLAFWIISGDTQQGLPGEALPRPIVVEVRDQSGEPLPDVQVTFTVSSGGGTLSVTNATTDSDGRAESTLTLGPEPGTNTVTVSVTGIQVAQTVTATAEPPPIPEDVNGDDVVNILDLVSVASVLGEAGQDLMADVNGDGIVNILDLVLVAGALGDVAAAPSAWYRDMERDFLSPSLSTRLIAPTTADVGRWLAQAETLDLTDPTSLQGVMFLEQLLAALTPNQTALLSNYPNPFNPETWIPYQLAEDADVALTIYDTNGIMVRRLDLGHQSAGYYADRGKAAYWDGRNGYGEQVASGVYFYLLSAGDFSAARKMLIRK